MNSCERYILPAALLLLVSWARGAQLPEVLQRLPPIDVSPESDRTPTADAPAFRLARDPPEYRTPEEVLPPRLPAWIEAPPSAGPELMFSGPHLIDHKEGFFQKFAVSAGQIVRDGSDGLGQTETMVFATFAVPAPTTDWPLLVIPTFEPTALDGPPALALPSWVYAAHLDLMWLPKIGERWLGVLAGNPGWYSDFEGDTGDAFRLTGQAIVRYDWTPDRLQFVLGAAYIHRINRTWLPVAGIIWKPNDDWTCNLVFPEGKIGHRVCQGEGYEHWLYFAGGFGGNNWRVQRPGGDSDILAILDWRLILGWERKLDGGAGVNVEVGYIFSRELEFASTGIVYPFGSTVMLRAGLAF